MTHYIIYETNDTGFLVWTGLYSSYEKAVEDIETVVDRLNERPDETIWGEEIRVAEMDPDARMGVEGVANVARTCDGRRKFLVKNMLPVN